MRAGALRLRCVCWGEPEESPVLLLHGAGAHARWFEALVPALLPGWRLIAPDLRGHGESGWGEPPYLVEDFYEDVRAVLDQVAPPPRKVVLVGHSMGGRIAVWYAAHHPERVRALALLDTRIGGLKPERVDRWRGVTVGEGPRRVYPTRERALAAFRVIPPEPGIAPEVLAQLAEHAIIQLGECEWALRFDRRVLALEGSRLGDVSHLLGHIRCPALVMNGKDSTVTNAAECAATAAALGNCPVQTFAGGHHFLLVQPQAVGEALQGFLDRIREEQRGSS